jgi:hypothetical protein
MGSFPFKRVIRSLLSRAQNRIPTAPFRLPDNLATPDFLEDLASRRIRYVVLPWSPWALDANDPEVHVLVHDDDAPAITDLLVRSHDSKNTAVCPYTAHFLPSFGWNHTSLFPPYLARGILERRIDSGGIWFPSPIDSFRSLVFNALYHEGGELNATPLPESGSRIVGSVIQRKALELGLEPTLDPDVLDAYLGAVDWRPSLDRLEYWGEQIAFCRAVAERLRMQITAPKGLAVFVVRDAASDENAMRTILSILETFGFEIIYRRNLRQNERDQMARYARGGDWGPGPFSRSGGAPAVVIVVKDPNPVVPRNNANVSSPVVDNERIFSAKVQIREAWNSSRTRDRWENVIHASDNAYQASCYVRLAGDDSILDMLVSGNEIPDPN